MVANVGKTQRLYFHTGLDSIQGLVVDVIYWSGEGSNCPQFITDEELEKNDLDDIDDDRAVWRPLDTLIRLGWRPNLVYEWPNDDEVTVMRMILMRQPLD